MELDATGTHKDHYHSDLHKLNLKRKVADLPPVSEASYAAHLESEKAKADAAAAESIACVYVCDACHKSFANVGPFNTHLVSKKHVARVKELLASAAAASASGGAGASVAEASVATAAATAPASSLAAGPAAPAVGIPRGGGAGESKSGEGWAAGSSAPPGAAWHSSDEASLTVTSSNCAWRGLHREALSAGHSIGAARRLAHRRDCRPVLF